MFVTQSWRSALGLVVATFQLLGGPLLPYPLAAEAPWYALEPMRRESCLHTSSRADAPIDALVRSALGQRPLESLRTEIIPELVKERRESPRRAPHAHGD